MLVQCSFMKVKYTYWERKWKPRTGSRDGIFEISGGKQKRWETLRWWCNGTLLNIITTHGNYKIIKKRRKYFYKATYMVWSKGSICLFSEGRCSLGDLESDDSTESLHSYSLDIEEEETKKRNYKEYIIRIIRIIIIINIIRIIRRIIKNII